jgi:hypothetical protein
VKRIILISLFLLCASSAHATTYYWAQTAASQTCNGGTHTTVTTSTILSTTLAPDDVVVQCGTITFSANDFAFAFGQSGTSGHVITLMGESGAHLLTSPAWNPNGAISLGGRSFVRVTNMNLTATANGSGLANQLNSMGIQMSGASDYEIDHNSITHLYDHTSTTDVTPDVQVAGCLYANGVGNNILIHDNTLSDGPWCINLQFSAPASNLQIYNNDISRVPHAIVLGGTSSSPGGALSNVKIYGNYVHDNGNWGTTTGSYHIAGYHFYGVPGNTSISGLQVYNNKFDGTWGNAACPTDPGSCITAFVFEEAGTSEASISGQAFFNNLGISDAPINNGIFGIYSGSGSIIVNNTMICSTTTTGICFGTNTNLTGLVFRNNVMTTANQLILSVATYASLSPNKNVYANGGGNAFVCNGNFYTFGQFTNWKSCVGSAGDALSLAPVTATLSSVGVPQTGSVAIGLGDNLTSTYCGTYAAMCSDINGSARPSGSTAWDSGALNSGGAPPPTPAPPTGLHVISIQ